MRSAIDIFEQAYDQLSRTFDDKEGGFGSAPKFPRPVALNFLTRFYARNCEMGGRDSSRAVDAAKPNGSAGASPSRADADAKSEEALRMDLVTLRKMAAGGIHDHLGGGFHRYSVDRFWHVPHFEKMLYDQAQLAVAYLDAFQITQDSQYESVACDILDYVERDMTSKGGGFYSAEDADSLFEEGKPEHGEGVFYVWTKKEIDAALGDAAEIFDFHYGVQPHGNAPEGSDPQDEFRGKNVLIERHAIADTAKHFARSEGEVRQSLARSREKLLAIRNKRPRPHLDDKIIASWNGLMISAFARAARVLNDSRYLESAVRAAEFVRANLWDKSQLYRSYREGRGGVTGFADDYAFVTQGLLDLYEASFDVEWFKFAVELQQTQDRLFLDEKNGGYFSTSGKDKSVVLRMKDDNDSAEPAASSVAALNLLRLAQIRDDETLRKRAEKSIAAFTPQISHFPSAMPQMLVAFDYSLAKPKQIVIAGKRDAPDTHALLGEVSRHFLPNTIVLLADGAEGQKYLQEKLEALTAMSQLDGKATAYACENFVCRAPVNRVDALRELLMKR